jgi:hypothetical protein
MLNQIRLLNQYQRLNHPRFKIPSRPIHLRCRYSNLGFELCRYNQNANKRNHTNFLVITRLTKKITKHNIIKRSKLSILNLSYTNNHIKIIKFKKDNK